MIVEEIRDDAENFPAGLRVLAVDDDPTCLKLLETLLRKCLYNVTATSQARIALKMIRENKDRFDLVISDVHMPDMDGFKLLELVGLEMDLPVIMLSANSDPKLVMKGVTHGACDYLVKPVRIEELRNIWQHVIRRKKLDSKNQNRSSEQDKALRESGDLGSPLAGNTDQNGKFNRKRKDDDDDSEDNGNEYEDPGAQKKPRVVWSIELHRKFVAAVNQLGLEKAVPKRILDMMNVEGLTRENVASHLQKYRLYLKRISSVASHQANMAAALEVRDAPFMRMGSLDSLQDFRTLAGSRLSNVALSPYTNGGMLGRLNSSGNVNLRNLTPPTLVQPRHAQDLSNPISSLREMHLALPSSSQNPSPFHEIKPYLELDYLQQNNGGSGATNINTINNSKLFRTASTFSDTGAAIVSSNDLLNYSSMRNPRMQHGSAQAEVSGGGFESKSAHEMAFNSESLSTGVSGSSSLLVPQNGLRDDNSINSPFVLVNPTRFSSAMALPPIEDFREMQCKVGLVDNLHIIDQVPGQSWVDQSRQNYDHSYQFPVNGNVYNMGQSLDQSIGPIGERYDPLDELVNVMINREHGETVSDGEFGFDGYSFGPRI